MRALFSVEKGDARTALAALLRTMMANGIVSAVYGPLRTTRGETVIPALVHDSEMLDDVDPFAPLLLFNGARAAAAVSNGDVPGRIAALLRSCEMRALIELAKLKQATLEHLFVVGVDCAGTYETADYRALRAAALGPTAELLGRAREDTIAPHQGYSFRPACRMCEYPTPPLADMTIGVIGVDGDRTILVETDDATAEKLGLSAGEAPRRATTLQRLANKRTSERDQQMAALTRRLADAAALAEFFAACQRCHNCMVACPICYCKECLFRTAAFEHEPMRFLRWAERKGATRMLADTVLFHLTRLNHMSTSCVGCGACESACPNGIPLTVLFRTVAARTQALFDYVPGRRLDEELPLTVFREAELE